MDWYVKKKRFTHVEAEIMAYLRERGKGTFKQIMEYFKEEYIDPPNPVRVREKLVKMFLKEKIDRVRIRSYGKSEYIYFLPDNIPQEVISNIKEEEQ